MINHKTPSPSSAGFAKSQFHIPEHPRGMVYLCGNSLGLQPKSTRALINEELEDWARLGVEGHFHARRPWMPYHEFVRDSLARVVGAKPIEVVAMNQLTVNLHLMAASFYRPTRSRFKILIEAGAFPSDRYAMVSQIQFHAERLGLSDRDVRSALIEVAPPAGQSTLPPGTLEAEIKKAGESLALVLVGNVNYLTGQAFDLPSIVRAGHSVGAQVGFDLAHGAGNLNVKLHESGADFAVWCSYKYLNSGPGGIAGAFVHERHAHSRDLPRFSGWWGHDQATRFQMGPDFKPIPGAEGWQLSNPPIFQLAALKASLEIFDAVGIETLRDLSVGLTSHLEKQLDVKLASQIESITPKDPEQRGCQLSLRLKRTDVNTRAFQKKLMDQGVVADFREPNILRVAPTPLYTTPADVDEFVVRLEAALRGV